MSITFCRKNNELILSFFPEFWSSGEILKRLEDKGGWRISRCFFVNKSNFRGEDSDGNQLLFCIGKTKDSYTEIDKSVLGTKHRFFFSDEIKLQTKYFIAYRNISILSKIDDVVDKDVYIGGDKSGALPFNTFNELIKNFPKSAELDHYARSRISTILKEFFPSAEQYEIKFQRYTNRRSNFLSSTSVVVSHQHLFENTRIELEQFKTLYANLCDLLCRADSVPEKTWQDQVHGLLRLLYPKYVVGIREVVIKGVDRHDKRPDFLLVDANGYIDILEIKKPSVQILTNQSSYRNNYVPVRELSGAVQQIEKYIYCLNVWGKEGEIALRKQLAGKLPASLVPKVLNPQGILLLGRSANFNRQQRSDFELIKRQYKNIVEIMTYDDLILSVNNIIDALAAQISTRGV